MTGRKASSLAVAAAVLGLAGCAGERQQDETAVRLVYVNWDEGIAMTHLVAAVLEEEMGARVRMTAADVAPVFTAVAQGDADAFVDVWLPTTHESYVAEYGKDFVDLGPVYEGARIGLVVPDYVAVSSIEELRAQKEKFGGEIVGIDSGAGIMKKTEEAIGAYGLDCRLLSSSGPAMAAALQEAIGKEAWIVVTGWKPHWKFARWKLKFLDDPRKVYGETERIHKIVRKGLEKDLPGVAALLRSFRLTDEQLGTLMAGVREEGDPARAAKAWMDEHRELVASWLPPGKKAAAGEGDTVGP